MDCLRGRALTTAAGVVVIVSAVVVSPVRADAATPAMDWSTLKTDVGTGGLVYLTADITAPYADQLTVNPGQPVVLDLDGHSLLIANPNLYNAAIGVGPGAALTVIDSAGSGSLNVTGSRYGAGIGGGLNGDAGSITINGGTVTAAGGYTAAGIGGGGEDLYPGGSGGTVTINDGTVNVRGGDYGAGIGTGGHGASTGSLTVRGGTLAATGGEYSAGLGGGYYASGQSVTIAGGSVSASGGMAGAGIGGGAHGGGGVLQVSAGTVTAQGGDDAAGIGGGPDADGAMVTASGGSITATGGSYGAGIGGGADFDTSGVAGSGGSLSVSATALTATGGSHGAGIGGGAEADRSGIGGGGASVTVQSDASVTAADGGYGASAIGAGPGSAVFGSLSNAGSVTIPDGASLIVPAAATASNSGTIQLNGSLGGSGTVTNSGRILPVGSGTVAGDGQGPAGTALVVDTNSYELPFDVNGSDSTPAPPLVVFAATIAAAGQSLPPGPTPPAGTRFTGWYTSPTGGSQVTDVTDLRATFGLGPTQPTLYAQYAALPAQPVTFTSTPPSPAYVGTTYQVSATGGGSSNPVIFSVDSSSTLASCTVGASTNNSATVSFTGAGQCVIDANQAAGPGYGAGMASQSITVTTRPQPTQDTMVSTDQPKASTTIVSPKLTTSGPNELIVAYVESDGPQSPTQQVTAVAGGGLTWRLSVRSNATWGTAEVWYAYASGSFAAAVGAGLRYSADASITVVAYKNAAAAPASAHANAGVSRTSSVTVTPSQAGSLVVASAHNWTINTPPKPATGQVFVHSYNDRHVHDAFWVQTTAARTTGTPPAAVTLSDTIPSNSRWMMAAVEISSP